MDYTILMQLLKSFLLPGLTSSNADLRRACRLQKALNNDDQHSGAIQPICTTLLMSANWLFTSY